jgi:hypothetical protein
MANVLNKITKQYLSSVNTPDYPASEWLINPILPNCDQKFWVIEDDTIRKMIPTEKDAYLYTYESTVYLIAEKQLLTNQDGADYESDTNAIINPAMPNVDLKYTKVVAGKVVEMTLKEQDMVDLAEAIPARQSMIKQECASHILAEYSESIQRSASLGIYSSRVIRKMTIFIAGCIKEENRCFDELEAFTTIEKVNAMIPTFPKE